MIGCGLQQKMGVDRDFFSCGRRLEGEVRHAIEQKHPAGIRRLE